MKHKVPRLIVGGASKSGTTALYYYLRQHPELYLSEKKELHYFSRPFLERSTAGPGDRYILAEIPTTYGEYLGFFNGCAEKQVVVDISPSYLFYKDAASEIRRLSPDSRIIFILRNPADKAYSQYLHLTNAGRETLSFKDALIAEHERQRLGFADMWLYQSSGFYADALQHYIDIFGRGDVALFFYEEFQQDPESVLRNICKFAGIDSTFQFTCEKEVNVSGMPRSILVSKLTGPTALTHFLRRIVPRSLGKRIRRLVKELNTGEKPKLDSNIRRELLEGYRDDIRRTEALVGRPSGWLS